ncbi:MAG TPA: hypothetical protein VGR47_19920 [Terracidiphilus sp.]|nr:hypothetical protein [Terracidiphilus sp.]
MNKASAAFGNLWGVRRIDVHIVNSQRRQAVQTWKHLESALLAAFRDRYFQLPKYNLKKGSVKHADDIRLFRRNALENLLKQFEE